MAVTEYWLGYNTETSATVVCVSDATATVAITCNGGTYTAAADTAVLGGGVLIEVTGLVAGNRYDYYVDGVYGGSLKTKPASGEVVIVYGSCFGQYGSPLMAALHASDLDPDVVIFGGDFPYSDTAANTFEGVTTVGSASSIANSKDTANQYKQHRKIRRFPGIKEVLRNYPTWYMADDHEWVFDNAAKVLSLYQARVTGAGAAVQADLDEAWQAAANGIALGGLGNPPNTDAGIDSDAAYFRASFPNIELFVTDACRYRNDPTIADGAGKRMLGAPQESWLAGSINGSAATFKLWVTPKQFWRGAGNTDTYHYQDAGNPGYQTELLRTLYAVKDTSGLFAVAGDQHAPNDQIVSAGELGAGYPAMSCLVGCPTNVPHNTTTGTGYDAGIAWKGYTESGGVRTNLHYNVCAVFKVTSARVERYLFTMRGLIPRGYIEAGSNQVQYPQTKFG